MCHCKLTVIDDVETGEQRHFEGDTLGEIMEREFEHYRGEWFLYRGNPSHENDISPKTADEYDALRAETGEFHLLICAKGAAAIVAVSIVATLFVASAFFFSKPEIPAFETISNTQQKSPNNEFGNRQNKFRIGDMVPIILGQQKSIPDLLTTPLTTYIDHKQVETFYACIGVGSYQIDADNVRDGDTAINKIDQASCEIYGPNTSPKIGTPQLQIGDPITQTLKSTNRSNSVNGQTLLAPNNDATTSSFQFKRSPTDLSFEIIDQSLDVDYTEIFSAGDFVTVTNAYYQNYPTGSTSGTQIFDSNFTVNSSGRITSTVAFNVTSGIWNCSNVTATLGGVTRNLDGAFVVKGSGSFSSGGVTYYYVDFYDPEFINSNWTLLTGGEWVLNGGVAGRLTTLTVDFNETYLISAVSARTLKVTAPNGSNPRTIKPSWYYVPFFTTQALILSNVTVQPTTVDFTIGPFETTSPCDEVILNVIAPNGAYKDDGQNQYSTDVSFLVSIAQYDANNNLISSSFASYDVEGNKNASAPRAKTVVISGLSPSAARTTVSARRNTLLDTGFSGRVVDEIKWRDLYFRNNFPSTNFGNVTTAYVRLYATESATSVKNRQFNLDVISKLPRWINGAFTSTLYPTRDAADIICAISVDDKIGRLDVANIDCDQIHATVDEIQAYFGFTEAGYFDYTFANKNLSYEEVVSSIADAIFSRAYRIGGKIKLFFDKPQPLGVMLFNHRNVLADSFERQYQFTIYNNYNGVEYQYRSLDGDLETVYVPSKSEATNAERIDSVGVTDDASALRHAWRAWNKRKYNRELVTFTATQESQIVKVGDKIYVADNARPNILDGEVLDQTGLTLTLSQPVDGMDLLKDYVIQLQLRDGTVQIIPITYVDKYRVNLLSAPNFDLITDSNSYARTTYMIVEEGGENSSAYIVVEKTPNNDTTIKFSAVSYQDEFYQND